jgi:hypothetical protein
MSISLKLEYCSFKKSLHCFLIIFFLGLTFQSHCQDLKYNPKGNPEKWSFYITPFFILPWVSGNVQSQMLSKDFGIDPSDFIRSLNGTFMIDAEISRVSTTHPGGDSRNEIQVRG